jgi:hypothetical protein
MVLYCSARGREMDAATLDKLERYFAGRLE